MIQLNCEERNLLINKLFTIHAFFSGEGTYFENIDRKTIVQLTECCIDLLNNHGVYLEQLSQKVYDRTKGVEK